MKLTVDWLTFENQIKQFIKRGQEINNSFKGARTEFELQKLQTEIKQWEEEVISYLKTSFDTDKNELVRDFSRAKHPRFDIPTLIIAGPRKDTTLLIKQNLDDLSFKTQTLSFNLRIVSVSDEVTKPNQINLEARKKFDTSDTLDFILDKLYELYDDNLYPIVDILNGNGIELPSYEDRKLVQTLESMDYVESSVQGKAYARLTIPGRLYVEQKNRVPKVEEYTTTNSAFVSESRLIELKAISAVNLDFSRLIRLCEELNSNYSNSNYLSVGMIGRTIINHVPPIFGFTSFEQVTGNYGGPNGHRSFKKNMKHLNESLRNIADSFLHQTIRDKETLPNETQIDFKQDLDVLLGEIVRILK